LDRTYTLGLGSALLDLSGLDFAGRAESVDVSVDVGDLTIIVPPDVDVRAEATVDVGNVTLFGTSWGGIGQSTRTITDLGVDGPGGGELTIRGTVDVGDLEVRR
jgi:predicted membrane protein